MEIKWFRIVFAPITPHLACLEATIAHVTNQNVHNLSASELESVAWPVVFEVLHSLASLRHSVRIAVLSAGGEGSPLSKEAKRALLEACDRMRDDGFARAGVRLQDRASTAVADPTEIPFLGLVQPALLMEEIRLKQKVGSRSSGYVIVSIAP